MYLFNGTAYDEGVSYRQVGPGFGEGGAAVTAGIKAVRQGVRQAS